MCLKYLRYQNLDLKYLLCLKYRMFHLKYLRSLLLLHLHFHQRYILQLGLGLKI
jgi:hypothetical protein